MFCIKHPSKYRTLIISDWLRGFRIISSAPQTYSDFPDSSSSSLTLGPTRWPEDDDTSSPIYLYQGSSRSFYPKNRLRIEPMPHLRSLTDWDRLRAALAKRLPQAIDPEDKDKLSKWKKELWVRLTGDMAPQIVNEEKMMEWDGQELFFHPLQLIPRELSKESQSLIRTKRLVIMNLCYGWSKKELDTVIDDAFAKLNLKGSYKCDLGDDAIQTRWSSYTFYQFEFEEDAERVWNRYGHSSVIKNPGSGLIFENLELWIGKSKPSTALSNLNSGLPGPGSWPQDDGSSSPILLADGVFRSFYPKNRIRVHPSPELQNKDDWNRFREVLAALFPQEFDPQDKGNIERREILKIRLTGDFAPAIVNSGKSLHWKGQEIFFHPLKIDPRVSTEELPDLPPVRKLVIMNLCYGWSEKDLASVIDEGFAKLNLKGSYRRTHAQKNDLAEVHWTPYTFYEFQYKEDAEKVMERYGSKAVMNNPGSGLIFENLELWIGKEIKPSKPDSKYAPPITSSWPEDNSSSPLLVSSPFDRVIYPKNRLRISPFPVITREANWKSFRHKLASRLPRVFDPLKENLGLLPTLSIRLVGDFAPEIVNDGKPFEWGKQLLYFHPLPHFLMRDSKAWVKSAPRKTIIMRNLCYGWSRDELDTVLDKGFKKLKLKGRYETTRGKAVTRTRWSNFTACRFEHEEDVEKVMERYGREAVTRNPGSGLIFENYELWISRVRPSDVRIRQTGRRWENRQRPRLLRGNYSYQISL
jgi:hypothetical protein